jgi:hypothetical protein
MGVPPDRQKSRRAGQGTRCGALTNRKGPAGAEPFLFLPYIFRIPSLEIKHAKYLWVSWVVSGVECWVITSVFSTKA